MLEKREPDLSITQFSVQLFTLTPVAEHCAANTDIVEVLFKQMVLIIEPGFDSTTGLKLQSIRSFDYSKFSGLLHDCLQIFRNIKQTDIKDLTISLNLENFIYFLYMLTHMEQNTRKTDTHVQYDRDNYDYSNFICIEVQKIVNEYVKFIIGSDKLAATWTILETYTSQSPYYQGLLKNDPTPIYKNRKKMSFFGSLTWFWAALMEEALKQDKMAQVTPPARLVKIFTIDSLARLLFSAEVKGGLWVRNGSIVLQQVSFKVIQPALRVCF